MKGGADRSSLLFLRDWALVILQFISDKYGEIHVTEFKNAVEQSYQKSDKRGLKAIFDELRSWIGDFPQSDKNEMNLILFERFGHDLSDQQLSVERQIHKIIRRGKIRNEMEFQIMYERVGEIFETPERVDEVHQINRLLSDYESRR